MKKFIIFFIFLLNINFLFAEDGYIACFNAYKLGEVKKDYKKTAKLLSSFDIVGIVEVINKDGVSKLVDELNKIDKNKWKFHISPYGVGSKNFKEYFAYIYRKDKVKFLKSRGFYKNMRSPLIREPYGADFKIGNFDFTFVLVHNIYGQNIRQRKAENSQMMDVYDYFQNLDEYENDIIIGGDFNLYSLDSSFKKLRQHKDKMDFALSPDIKTTIGYKGLANSYDNFIYSKIFTREFTGRYGAIDFASANPSYFRNIISDHLPVFMIVNTLSDDD